MAKVVKFCAACEEGFAEKFGFCPNCGGALAAYEMNPIGEKTNPVTQGNFETKASVPAAPVVSDAPAVVERKPEPVMESFSAHEDDEFLEIDSAPVAEKPAPAAPAVIAPVVIAPATARSSFDRDFTQSERQPNGNGASSGHQKAAVAASAVAAPAAFAPQSKYSDGAYHITFVEEKNAGGRNLLLLASFLLITTLAIGGTIYSLYSTDALIGTLGEDTTLLAYINEEAPAVIEPDPPPKKNPDEGGGGGGGGKENPEPASKGRLPNQVEKPIMPPQPLPQVTNASLPNPNETQGNIKRDKTDEPVGIPTGSLSGKLSSGSGSGGGIGNGRGSGVGSGIGTGEGSGIGSGSGNGRGNGNGDGDGDGDSVGRPPAPKPPAPKVTTAMSIISKPRPSYTDAARQNQVTGVVRLRVTFLASGQIGSVSSVSGLSYGLTEQAIAAAKQIRFEPQKINGVAQTVTKQIEYSFSIY